MHAPPEPAGAAHSLRAVHGRRVCLGELGTDHGRPALVTMAGIRTMHAKKAVDSTKAIRELGASFRPFEETVRDEVEWFRSRNGQL
jgi:dihydroflavonol-4-reductase